MKISVSLLSILILSIPFLLMEACSANDSKEYFTQTDTLFKDFAPGVIRPDEGIIELTMRIDKPIDEFGNTWDFVFSLMTAQKSSESEKNIFALYIPELPEKGLVFLIRTGESSYYLRATNFSYTPGKNLI